LVRLGWRGIQLGGQRNISPTFCSEAVTIQANGATNSTAPAISRTYTTSFQPASLRILILRRRCASTVAPTASCRSTAIRWLLYVSRSCNAVHSDVFSTPPLTWSLAKHRFSSSHRLHKSYQ